jgi:hypothetical protein
MSSSTDNGSGANIGWGFFWLAAGIIGTIATNGQFLFYGAILVGILRIVRGFIQAADE